MRGRRLIARLILGMTAPALVAGTLAGPATPSSSAASCPAWSGQQPASIPGATDTRFHGVAVVSGCDVWAVGDDANDPESVLNRPDAELTCLATICHATK